MCVFSHNLKTNKHEKCLSEAYIIWLLIWEVTGCIKSLILLFKKKILAVLGPHCCEGFSLLEVHGFLIAVTSLVAEHGF